MIPAGKPKACAEAWMAVGALPFIWGIFPKREIAIMGVPDWPGFTQGFDVSLLDLLIVALYRKRRLEAIEFSVFEATETLHSAAE